jgi:hypothetical protein
MLLKQTTTVYTPRQRHLYYKSYTLSWQHMCVSGLEGVNGRVPLFTPSLNGLLLYQGVGGLEGLELVSDSIIMKLLYSDKVSISECIAQT